MVDTNEIRVKRSGLGRWRKGVKEKLVGREKMIREGKKVKAVDKNWKEDE